MEGRIHMLLCWPGLLTLLFLLWVPFLRYDKAVGSGIQNSSAIQSCFHPCSPGKSIQCFLAFPKSKSLFLQVFNSKFPHIDLLHEFSHFVIPVAHTRILSHHTRAGLQGCSRSVELTARAERFLWFVQSHSNKRGTN